MCEQVNDDIEYTSNEEMDSLQPGDNLAEVVLAVETIEPIRRRSNTPIRIPLTKFVATNTFGRTIKLLFWDDQATGFGGTVVQKNLHIPRARVAAFNANYIDHAAGLMAIELHIQKQTEVKILENYNITAPAVEYRPVRLIYILREINNNPGGVVHAELEGYIKQRIALIQVDVATYGAGSITDGYYKIRVNVASFEEMAGLDVNTHVRLRGHLSTTAAGIPFIQLATMGNIDIIDEEHLELRVLRAGFRNPPAGGDGL